MEVYKPILHYSILFKDESSSMFDSLLRYHTEATSIVNAINKFKHIHPNMEVFDVYMDSQTPRDTYYKYAIADYANHIFHSCKPESYLE